MFKSITTLSRHLEKTDSREVPNDHQSYSRSLHVQTHNGALASIQGTPLVYEGICTLSIFNSALLYSYLKKKNSTLYTSRVFQIQLGDRNGKGDK